MTLTKKETLQIINKIDFERLCIAIPFKKSEIAAAYENSKTLKTLPFHDYLNVLGFDENGMEEYAPFRELMENANEIPYSKEDAIKILKQLCLEWLLNRPLNLNKKEGKHESE